jgi:hypothetical protein
MADLPIHRSAEDEDEKGTAGTQSANGPNWKPVMRIAVAVALVVLFALLHVTGVIGLGSH